MGRQPEQEIDLVAEVLLAVREQEEELPLDYHLVDHGRACLEPFPHGG